jgi:hypothetical protein
MMLRTKIGIKIRIKIKIANGQRRRPTLLLAVTAALP